MEAIDLKQLIYAINDQKGLDINFCMDEGCVYPLSDKKMFIKVLNYLLNYMNSLHDSAFDLSLELLADKFQLSMISAIHSDLPQLADGITEQLTPEHITFNHTHEAGKFLQLRLSFPLKQGS